MIYLWPKRRTHKPPINIKLAKTSKTTFRIEMPPVPSLCVPFVQSVDKNIAFHSPTPIVSIAVGKKILTSWPKRPEKITVGEMRSAGVHGLLIYCSDFHCSHWVAISGGLWPDDVRLSDLEPRFTCAIEIAAWRRGSLHLESTKLKRVSRSSGYGNSALPRLPVTE
jgi:hypothetical protein